MQLHEAKKILKQAGYIIDESAGTATGELMQRILQMVKDEFSSVAGQWRHYKRPEIDFDDIQQNTIKIVFLGIPASIHVDPDKNIITFMIDASEAVDMDSFGYQWHSLDFMNDNAPYYNEDYYDGNIWEYSLGKKITLPQMIYRWFDARENMPEIGMTIADISEQARRECGLNSSPWENPELYADHDTYGYQA